jgi:hypothetical protein
MAMLPWERLFVQGDEHGVLESLMGIVLGGFGRRRPVVGINSSGKCDKLCTRLRLSHVEGLVVQCLWVDGLLFHRASGG